MAIISIGYDTPLDEKQFEAIIGYSASSKYGVNMPSAFAASTITGQVLKVRIAPGTAWTSGTVDIMDAEDSVTLEPVASGSRWDMIVLRRDYQPEGGGPTRLAVIKGGSTMTLPARNTNAGVLDDQPLWLVRVDAGKSIPSQYVDLRVWARNGGCTASHDLVRSYLNSAGTMIEINGVLWLSRVGANNQGEWVKPIELALAGDVTVDRIRVQNQGDVSPTSTGHGLQVGPDNGSNVALDGNEILARVNGKASWLWNEAGYSQGFPPTQPSHLTRKDYVDESRMGGSIASGTLSVTPTTKVTDFGETYYRGSVWVNFPAGRFTGTPHVVVSENTEVPGRVRSVSAVEATSKGFRAWVARNNTSNVVLTWVAVQATA